MEGLSLSHQTVPTSGGEGGASEEYQGQGRRQGGRVGHGAARFTTLYIFRTAHLIAQPSQASTSMGQLELWLALYFVVSLPVCPSQTVKAKRSQIEPIPSKQLWIGRQSDP
jgi:hypothetical protein